MKVVYEIPDFLMDKFTNMEESDVCAYITRALVKDGNITDRLCLDMRIDQKDNFTKILDKLAELADNIKTGVVITESKSYSPPIAVDCEEVKEEKYVALDVGDDDDDEDDFGDFIM